MRSSIEEFDYDLPETLIAQSPAEPRDHARLLVVDRETSHMAHKRFYGVLDEFHEGDVMVLNDSKVFKARLKAHVVGRDIPLEVVLLRHEDGVWEALVKKLRRLRPGSVIQFEAFTGKVLATDNVGGTAKIKINLPFDEVIRIVNRIGEVPLPPYIDNKLEQLDDYQTVYAEQTGSVAAPTAGLHFTPELLENIRQKGVQVVFVTLHVGLGTFQPIWEGALNDHKMHSEFVQISAESAKIINRAKEEGRRVVAVGTTSVRSLEGAAQDGHLPERGFAGDVDLFITPGFSFQIVDALITNFHLPRTSLLVLVSAFAGKQLIKDVYQEAIKERYRFYSLGDAMMIN